jgi:hypothetical protein
MTQHSPEPWRLTDPGGISDANGMFVADWRNSDLRQADLARIVACVNACRGIPNDLLEMPGGFQQMMQALLAACRSADIECTCIGYIVLDYSTFHDDNKAVCCECGWQGHVHDLAPTMPPLEQLSDAELAAVHAKGEQMVRSMEEKWAKGYFSDDPPDILGAAMERATSQRLP